jgi:hypothetical protein
MKVLDLECEAMHVFEGWFASEEDYSTQVTQAQIHCPVCGSGDVSKRLSAPRLNFGASREQQVADAPVVAAPVALDPVKALQQQWLLACRQVVANTVDVGAGFAEEARKIHYGEAPERAIRGQASLQETHSLLDEGIAVMPLLIPEGPSQ